MKTPVAAGERSPRRVFISYKHVEPDATVARELAASLSSHEVFIETEIPLVAAWGEVIEEKLGSADFLVALVSATAAASPLVLTEIAEAHRLNVEHQRPVIIPIRLGNGFRLRYPLSAYVSRFQQTTWTGPEDTPRLILQLKEALAAPSRRGHPAAQRLNLIEAGHGLTATSSCVDPCAENGACGCRWVSISTPAADPCERIPAAAVEALRGCRVAHHARLWVAQHGRPCPAQVG